jgi:hypothetical protein
MRRSALVLLLAAFAMAPDLYAQRQLYRSDAFVLTDTSVEQGQFRAVAKSAARIESNYQRAAGEVNFKFSINGLDNEHPPGDDYMIYLRPRGGRIVTPVYTFGVLEPPSTPAPELAAVSPEEGPADVTFRLDMRHVLRELHTRGSYKPPNGAPISKAAFQAVYVIGNTEPLSWDFSALVPGAPMQLLDPDGDSIYSVTLRFDAAFSRPLLANGNAVWELKRDLSRFPRLQSPHRLVDALHQLALEELRELERADGALNAGGRWPGVWTRDLAWSAMLGVVLVAPDAVRNGLLQRVDTLGRIIQDSGSGGSWPLSTDRVAWTMAAWELFAVTGDTAWLRMAHDVIRRSAEADLEVAFDSATGLFRGESTFLDWRDQSYPRWMDAKDIGHGQALGTNVLHYASYRLLARMARLLGEPADRWDRIADRVQRGLNAHLWLAELGRYGQYRYGRAHAVLSPRAEMLGAALSVIHQTGDAAQRSESVARTPVVPFGVPSFWPYIPDVPPYHNAGVWPQVVGFHAWAAADAGNAAAVEHALAALFRAAALFLTNKENWVATTGHFEGTEVNSDRFMASAAAQLAASYRVLFGIRLAADRMLFQPFVPRAYQGTRTLSGLRYRNATLTVTMHGFGNGARTIRLDGRAIERAEIPATLTGAHTLEITLNGIMPEGELNLVDNVAAPPIPSAALAGDQFAWRRVPGATSYVVFRNGNRQVATSDTAVQVTETSGSAEYQVLAVDTSGRESFASTPIRVGPPAAQQIVEPATPSLEATGGGYEGAGFIRLTTEQNTAVEIPIAVAAAAWYLIDARYTNGSGPISYGYKAAVRTLLVDRTPAGALLMPQRGDNRWEDWGYTNGLRVWLTAGEHTLTLAYREANRNMDIAVNTALLDHIRLTRLAD